ncbi:MAG: hypothetical protein Q4B13_04190 [Lautropia sp.]|nr:hypothetical protein [Lautropia sp.]
MTPSSTAHRGSINPRKNPALLPLTGLFMALTLGGCAMNRPDGIPEQMLTPETLQDAGPADANGEPYYLNYQVGDTDLENAFDDGSYTYIEFKHAVPNDLSCYDDAGAPLGCEAVGNVLAVQGTHTGILLRQADNAAFVAPNPKALPPPLRRIGHAPQWSAHAQARNRVMLKAPLREALENSATAKADPNLNQAAGLKLPVTQSAHLPGTAPAAPRIRTDDGRSARSAPPPIHAHPSQAGSAASTAWVTLPFPDNSAQLNAHHPVVARLLQQLPQADSIRIDIPGHDLLSQARLAAIRHLLNEQAVPDNIIRTDTSGTAAAHTASTGASAVRILLLRSGTPLSPA